MKACQDWDGYEFGAREDVRVKGWSAAGKKNEFHPPFHDKASVVAGCIAYGSHKGRDGGEEEY
jgi:hypothetical protein